jgi:hypothetical protein
MVNVMFYCHYEGRNRPAGDFTAQYLRNNDKYKQDVLGDPYPVKFVPRAVCDECLAKGHSLATKFREDYFIGENMAFERKYTKKLDQRERDMYNIL